MGRTWPAFTGSISMPHGGPLGQMGAVLRRIGVNEHLEAGPIKSSRGDGGKACGGELPG